MHSVQRVEIKRLPYEYEQPDRSKGLHLYDLIQIYRKKILKARFSNDDAKMLMFAIGHIWERVLETGYRDLCGIRPGEVIKDGVVMSPDGVIEDDPCIHTAVVAEHKFTFRSASVPITDIKYIMAQGAAYAYGLGYSYVRFNIFHLLGDYKRPYTPKFISELVYFSPVELQENWTMLVNLGKSEGLI